MQNHLEFSNTITSSCTWSSQDGSRIHGQTYRKETQSTPEGTTVRTTTQKLGESAVEETRHYDLYGREVLLLGDGDGNRRRQNGEGEDQQRQLRTAPSLGRVKRGMSRTVGARSYDAEENSGEQHRSHGSGCCVDHAGGSVGGIAAMTTRGIQAITQAVITLVKTA